MATKPFKPGGSPGKLHRKLGIPAGQTIPPARLAAAARSPDASTRNMAIRAETMKGWKHSGPKKAGMINRKKG